MPNILLGTGTFSFEEKRSRFLGHCETVTCEEEARGVIARIREQHRSASHHVYAYGFTGNNRYTRHSDDGEPQGTAGLPVLNVFIKQDVTDFVCVVTRYFGGTLLGAGGLTRAYAKAAKGTLESAGTAPLVPTAVYTVVCDYAQLEQMKYFFDKQGIAISRIDYGEYCEAVVAVPETAAAVFWAERSYTVL